MKKFISGILMMLFAITAMAQNDFVATLQHGEDISYYYGSGAFLSAYNAAAEGDVITLSSGSFGGCTVEKGITVRGVGIDAEGQSTNITGQVNVYSPSAESVTTFEGIRFSNYVYTYADGTKAPEAGHILFVKNRFSTFSLKNTDATVASTPKLDIINCVFENTPAFGVEYTNVKVYNSYISGSGLLSTTQSEVSNTAFINCLIYCPTYNGTFYSNYASFTNCIIQYYVSGVSTRIPSNATIMNCITNSSTVFTNIPNYTSKGNRALSNSEFDKMFKSGSFPTSWTKGATFELTDEAAATYLGVDDTQVGMHGGMYPYNTTVSYPIVTTFNTSGKTTNSGDLNIEVQVNNVQ